MPITFPDWADLGMGTMSTTIRNAWDQMLYRMEGNRYYFEGDVFTQTIPHEEPSNEPEPLMYPIGLNLVRMLCMAHADSAFGEWDEQPIQFNIKPNREATLADKAAVEVANNILEASNGPALFWELELERNIYGGGAFKIQPQLNPVSPIKWTRIPRENFFPIWDPDDPDDLLEAYAVVPMTADQAAAKYRYTDARGEVVYRVEHWTKFSYTNTLDGVPLLDYSGVNPWGVVPFVFTPRFRLHYWFGEDLANDIIPIQDDLNRVLADISDAINYNAHPVRWGINLPRDFNAKNFPLGPNALWNLGRALSGNPKPEVGIMEASAAISNGVFDYIKFVYDWSRISSAAPPIVFGEDEGGGQRSGVTLELRMWPILKAIRRSRSYLSGGLRRALYISGRILEQKKFKDVSSHAITALLEGRIVPYFYDVMPRDQAANVDEVVKLLSTDPPAISLETSQQVLGRGTGEVERIRGMMDDKELWKSERAAKNMAAAQSKKDGSVKDDQEKPVE
jgi:hypothetical protein